MTAKKDDKPKRKAPDPIPVVGVRGSGSMISAPKAIAAGGAALLVAGRTAASGANSPLVAAQNVGLQEGIDRVKLALRESWDSGNAKLAVGLLGGMALFGKAIDKRFRDFPIRFGR